MQTPTAPRLSPLTSTLLGAALALTLAVLGARPAEAAKLSVKVVTSSPAGFLVNSTLVMGEKEAVLIDGQFTLSDAHRLVATILESGKTLTTIYVTHFHPDHYFGLAVVKHAFPKARLVALPATVADIKKTWKAKLAAWQGMYGANLPAKPLVPEVLKGTTIILEGETLEIVGMVQGDAEDNSYVWIPSIRTLIAGDIVYSGVHPWTAETTPATRKAWIATLDTLTALAPLVVIAGHKKPELADDLKAIEFTRRYLIAFDEAITSSKTPAEAQAKLAAKFPGLALDIIAKLGTEAAF